MGNGPRSALACSAPEVDHTRTMPSRPEVTTSRRPSPVTSPVPAADQTVAPLMSPIRPVYVVWANGEPKGLSAVVAAAVSTAPAATAPVTSAASAASSVTSAASAWAASAAAAAGSCSGADGADGAERADGGRRRRRGRRNGGGGGDGGAGRGEDPCQDCGQDGGDGARSAHGRPLWAERDIAGTADDRLPSAAGSRALSEARTAVGRGPRSRSAAPAPIGKAVAVRRSAFTFSEPHGTLRAAARGVDRPPRAFSRNAQGTHS